MLGRGRTTKATARPGRSRMRTVSRETVAIIEEADKDDVDHDVIEAMESLVTDERDRIIAIANPPSDEINVVYDLMQDPEWETIQLSSFESHNVQIELGETDGEMIDGLATLHKIKKDWRRYNAREWPGVEAARNSYDLEGLDERWYKRRLGRIPPDTASVHRPFSPTHVEEAFDRDPITVTTTPQALALDVARDSGDYNVLTGLFRDELRVLDYWRGMDHVANEDHIRDLLGNWGCPFAIDEIGEGSALADNINTWYPNVIRFKAGGLPFKPTDYKNAWSEGMDRLGKQLKDSLAIPSTRLREELFAAGRSVTFDEVYVGKYDAEVFQLDPKEDIEERLERSPDLLDSAYMAIWIATGAEDGGRSVPSTW